MPYRAIAAQALATWRAAHARVEAALPNSDEWQAAYLDEQAAKAAYQEAFDAAHREHLPEPPPFERAAEDAAVADGGSADPDEPETTMTPPKTDGQMYGG